MALTVKEWIVWLQHHFAGVVRSANPIHRQIHPRPQFCCSSAAFRSFRPPWLFQKCQMACSLRMETVIGGLGILTTHNHHGFIHTFWKIMEMPAEPLALLQSCLYLIPLLIRLTFLTRRRGRLFVEIPLTTSANSVSSTSEGSAAGGRAGDTVVLRGEVRIEKV